MAAIGIDLGTTYSCVAVSEEGKFEVIANDQGERTTPSCVAFTDNERLIGQATKHEMLKNPKQTVIGIKRIIGRRFDDPVVQQEMKNWEFDIVDVQGHAKIQIERNGKLETYYPEQISAMILADLKKTAEDYIGKDVKKAVITVPAYFNNCQRSATKDAATIAGLDVIGMINEPTAAALALGVQKKITSTRNVLVFDLGGGTFDVTLMTITNGGREFDVKATAGDTHLGGVDFTRCVQKYFEEDFEVKTKKKFRASSRTMARVVKECEEAKKMLSTKVSASIFLENVCEGEDLDSKISRATFDKLTKVKFDRTLDLVKQVLDDSKIEKSQVDDVLLVGGSTRIPSIQDMLKKYFGADKIRKNTNPDEAVAAGAALHADFLSRQELSQSPEVVLKDVTPLSLGTRVEGGIMSVIIKRNTKIPAKAVKHYQTSRDNQRTICVKVYEGEQPKSKDNNFLGKFRFSGIPLKPAGEGKIGLIYEIDSFGVLNVSAIEKDTGKNESISISMEEGRMNDEEIMPLIEKAENERQVELESRIRNSAMNELESLINSTRLQVEDEQTASKSIDDPILEKCAEIETWINENQETSLEEIQSKRAILDALQTPL